MSARGRREILKNDPQDREEFLSELRTRLRVSISAEEAWCPLCDCVMDTRGHHAALCGSGGDRTCRHHGARNIVGDAANEGGLRPELEKPDLLPPAPDSLDANLRRPADVYLPNWRNGRPAALDLAITSPHRHDLIQTAPLAPGAAAAACVQRPFQAFQARVERFDWRAIE